MSRPVFKNKQPLSRLHRLSRQDVLEADASKSRLKKQANRDSKNKQPPLFIARSKLQANGLVQRGQSHRQETTDGLCACGNALQLRRRLSMLFVRLAHKKGVSLALAKRMGVTAFGQTCDTRAASRTCNTRAACRTCDTRAACRTCDTSAACAHAPAAHYLQCSGVV